jgi:hypothetical protein
MKGASAANLCGKNKLCQIRGQLAQIGFRASTHPAELAATEQPAGGRRTPAVIDGNQDASPESGRPQGRDSVGVWRGSGSFSRVRRPRSAARNHPPIPEGGRRRVLAGDHSLQAGLQQPERRTPRRAHAPPSPSVPIRDRRSWSAWPRGGRKHQGPSLRPSARVAASAGEDGSPGDRRCRRGWPLCWSAGVRTGCSRCWGWRRSS